MLQRSISYNNCAFATEKRKVMSEELLNTEFVPGFEA